MLRTGQQRLSAGLRGLGDHHGAAVIVAFHDKTRCHIVAQQRDIGAMGAVGERQCAAGLVAVRGIVERGVGAEGDSRRRQMIFSLRRKCRLLP